MTSQLVYQIFGPDDEPVSPAAWMTFEEACKLCQKYPEGCYAAVAEGIEVWEG